MFIQKYARKLGVLEYLGTWNASSNSPILASGIGQKNGYYIVSVAGTATLDGINDWQPGDWVIFNGTAWEKVDNSETVTSVAGMIGDVTLSSASLTDGNTLATKTYADSAVAVEYSRAQAAEYSLTASLTSEVSRAELAESSLNAALLTEYSRAILAESSLHASLVSESAARAAEDTSIRGVFLVEKEPTGFTNQTDSIVTFDETSRTLSVAPTVTSFEIWHQGVKSTISTTLTKQIPNTSGSYFFYITSAGVLDYATVFDPAILSTYVYTAYVYWNATAGKAVSFGEERHGLTMDNATHAYLHTTRGTQLVSGAAITYTTTGDGSSNADAQIGISDMQVRDEDILASINHNDSPSSRFQQKLYPVAYLPVYYRSGSYWTKDTGTAYPIKTGTNRAYYNKNTSNTWSLEEASGDGKYLVSYVFATTSVHEPVIAIMGQDEYTDLNDAQARASWSKVSFGDLPAQEIKLLYIVFYTTSSAYTNAPKAIIKSVTDLRYGGDREVSAVSSATDHGNLSGLADDDHVQYLLISGSRPMTGALDMGTHKINNVVDPTSAQDAATKNYVDLEKSRALSAEATLTTNLANEYSRAFLAESSLNAAIVQESSVRAAADLTFLTLDGSRSMAGDLKMATHAIRNITQPIATTRTVTAVTNTELALLSTDNAVMYITGTASGYSLKLPDSTSVDVGTYYEIYNSNSAAISVKYNNGSVLFTLNAASVAKVILQTNGTQNGVWSVWSLETGIASGITNYSASSTTVFSTTSTTDTAITDFVVTPQAGTYAIFFNSSNISSVNNALNYVTLYRAGVPISGTERVAKAVGNNFEFQLSTLGVATFNGTEELRVYVRVTTGTLSVNARTGVALRLGG